MASSISVSEAVIRTVSLRTAGASAASGAKSAVVSVSDRPCAAAMGPAAPGSCLAQLGGAPCSGSRRSVRIASCDRPVASSADADQRASFVCSASRSTSSYRPSSSSLYSRASLASSGSSLRGSSSSSSAAAAAAAVAAEVAASPLPPPIAASSPPVDAMPPLRIARKRGCLKGRRTCGMISSRSRSAKDEPAAEENVDGADLRAAVEVEAEAEAAVAGADLRLP